MSSAGADPAVAISVVVPTRDRPHLLGDCLIALNAALTDGDELIVVDSASALGSVREVAEAAGARYVRCDLPGASRARNAGWRVAKADVIAFIDDDVRVTMGWPAALRRRFADDPGVAFVTGSVAMPEGQDSVRPVALLEREQGEAIEAQTWHPDVGHSANLSVRRATLEKVGGFDERLGAGGDFHAAEDVDLFDRILAAGSRGYYDPAAQASHEQWRRREHFVRLDWGYGFGMGARLAKLVRTNRSRVWYAARNTFWFWGLYDVLYRARRRERFAASMALVRMAGAVVGLVRALPAPIRAGHFTRRG